MEYVYAGEIDSLALIARNNNAQKLIATRNQQWSIVSLCNNADGNVLERYTYNQFGERTILAPDGSTGYPPFFVPVQVREFGVRQLCRRSEAVGRTELAQLAA